MLSPYTLTGRQFIIDPIARAIATLQDTGTPASITALTDSSGVLGNSDTQGTAADRASRLHDGVRFIIRADATDYYEASGWASFARNASSNTIIAAVRVPAYEGIQRRLMSFSRGDAPTGAGRLVVTAQSGSGGVGMILQQADVASTVSFGASGCPVDAFFIVAYVANWSGGKAQIWLDGRLASEADLESTSNTPDTNSQRVRVFSYLPDTPFQFFSADLAFAVGVKNSLLTSAQHLAVASWINNYATLGRTI